MILSEETLEVLKNYSVINQNLLFQEGNVIKTMSPQKTIFSQAVINDNIDGRAGIYDLPRFLNAIGLFTNPELVFGDNKFLIKQGKAKSSYVFAADSMLVIPPEKKITMPPSLCDFDISWEDFNSVVKAALILSLPEIVFSNKDGVVSLIATDVENSSSDDYGITVAEVEGDDFYMILKRDNIKFMPRNYRVSLTDKGICQFKTNDAGIDLTYWAAIQHNSLYGETR